MFVQNSSVKQKALPVKERCKCCKQEIEIDFFSFCSAFLQPTRLPHLKSTVQYCRVPSWRNPFFPRTRSIAQEKFTTGAVKENEYRSVHDVNVYVTPGGGGENCSTGRTISVGIVFDFEEEPGGSETVNRIHRKSLNHTYISTRNLNLKLKVNLSSSASSCPTGGGFRASSRTIGTKCSDFWIPEQPKRKLKRP